MARVLVQERPTFQPKDIVYRTDEPGSSSPQRLVLRRKLHGERYGQKSGIKHPMGQYAHATGDTNLRMPGEEWRKQPGKGKYGTAGVTLDKRRKSPIVEISTLLVRSVLRLPGNRPGIRGKNIHAPKRAKIAKCSLTGD